MLPAAGAAPPTPSNATAVSDAQSEGETVEPAPSPAEGPVLTTMRDEALKKLDEHSELVSAECALVGRAADGGRANRPGPAKDRAPERRRARAESVKHWASRAFVGRVAMYSAAK